MNYKEIISKSSPRPWKIRQKFTTDPFWTKPSPEVVQILADEHLTVLAVNAHEKLVQALRDLIIHDQGCVASRGIPVPECCAYCRARLVLESVKE